MAHEQTMGCIFSPTLVVLFYSFCFFFVLLVAHCAGSTRLVRAPQADTGCGENVIGEDGTIRPSSDTSMTTVSGCE